MKRIRTIAALIAAAAIGLPLLACGQQQRDIGKEMDVGKREYDANCAVCHGLGAISLLTSTNGRESPVDDACRAARLRRAAP
jgi:mono/diheme cytochrome c family protein